MSRLDDLINEYCPEGVEYVRLDEVCSANTGSQLNKNELLENAKYPVINGGVLPSGFWNEFNTDKNTITISQGGASAGYVNYIKQSFWAGAHCYVIKKTNSNISYKFLYYFLKNKENKLQECQQGAGIPSLNRKSIYNLKIPLPPLPVQEEIVRILDTFTELTAKLTTELTLRKKQYEYYRDGLLKFGEESRNLCLKDILQIKNGKDYKQYGEGDVPVYGSGGIMTYIDTYVYDKPSVLIPRKGSLNKLYYVDHPFWTVDTIFYTITNEEIAIPKYVYYCLQSKHLEKLNNAGGVPSLTQAVLNKVEIPIPSMKIQERIVYVLDHFDKVCNDLNIGLPAEIEARNKQYEYYRDSLLTFAETGKIIPTDRQTDRQTKT